MKKLFILIASLMALFYSCKKKNIVEIDNTPSVFNNTFYFQITKDGQQLDTSILNNIKLYYIKDGERIDQHPYPYLDNREFLSKPNLVNNIWVLVGLYVGNPITLFHKKVGDSFEEYYPNNWYIEFPNGDVDTIYIVPKVISQKEGRLNPCYCNNPFVIVRFNGKDAPKHPTYKGLYDRPLYILEK